MIFHRRGAPHRCAARWTCSRRKPRDPDGIEAFAIVTPNNSRASAALASLNAGLHVICDKPLTTNLAKARELRDAAIAIDRIFAVTYNYSGYPLVRHARE